MRSLSQRKVHRMMMTMESRRTERRRPITPRSRKFPHPLAARRNLILKLQQSPKTRRPLMLVKKLSLRGTSRWSSTKVEALTMSGSNSKKTMLSSRSPPRTLLLRKSSRQLFKHRPRRRRQTNQYSKWFPLNKFTSRLTPRSPRLSQGIHRVSGTRSGAKLSSLATLRAASSTPTTRL